MTVIGYRRWSTSLWLVGKDWANSNSVSLPSCDCDFGNDRCLIWQVRFLDIYLSILCVWFTCWCSVKRTSADDGRLQQQNQRRRHHRRHHQPQLTSQSPMTRTTTYWHRHSISWICIAFLPHSVLPFRYRLARVVLDKGPLSGCVELQRDEEEHREVSVETLLLYVTRLINVFLTLFWQT